MKNTIRKALLALTGLACLTVTAQAADLATITRRPFGITQEGTPVEIYTLRNSHGCEARITNYGGVVVSLTMPDKNGKLDDMVLVSTRSTDTKRILRPTSAR